MSASRGAAAQGGNEGVDLADEVLERSPVFEKHVGSGDALLGRKLRANPRTSLFLDETVARQEPPKLNFPGNLHGGDPIEIRFPRGFKEKGDEDYGGGMGRGRASERLPRADPTANLRMEEAFEGATCGVVGKDERTEAATIDGPVGKEDLGTEATDDGFEEGFSGAEDLPGDDVRIQNGKPAFREDSSHGALSCGDPP